MVHAKYGDQQTRHWTFMNFSPCVVVLKLPLGKGCFIQGFLVSTMKNMTTKPNESYSPWPYLSYDLSSL